MRTGLGNQMYCGKGAGWTTAYNRYSGTILQKNSVFKDPSHNISLTIVTNDFRTLFQAYAYQPLHRIALICINNSVRWPYEY